MRGAMDELMDAGVRTRDLLSRPLAELPDPLPLSPLPGPFHASVRPPGSKSITNRLLVLAALAGGQSAIRGALVDADDARAMMRGLAQFGADVLRKDAPDGVPSLVVDGVGGKPIGGVTVKLGGSGTSVRFLTALAALADGPVTIDGDERMRERPIDELTSALRALRVRVEDMGERGRPPIRVHGDGVMAGGKARFTSPKSSQFISSLLLVAPWTTNGVEILTEGEVTSAPYIEMTLSLLRRLGGVVECASDYSRIFVGPGPIAPFTIDVEPDASGASYFWAAGMICPDSVCLVPGLSPVSLQGDIRFVNTLGAMGALIDATPTCVGVEAPAPGEPIRGVGANLAGMPDVAMTAAVCAAFATGPTVLTGLRTLRDKECDRLEATRAELTKIGAGVEVEDGLLRVTPGPSLGDSPVVFETYNDHRMAMSLALIGLRRPNVQIKDPGCVAKTYPTFWSDLARLYDAAL